MVWKKKKKFWWVGKKTLRLIWPNISHQAARKYSRSTTGQLEIGVLFLETCKDLKKTVWVLFYYCGPHTKFPFRDERRTTGMY